MQPFNKYTILSAYCAYFSPIEFYYKPLLYRVLPHWLEPDTNVRGIHSYFDEGRELVGLEFFSTQVKTQRERADAEANVCELKARKQKYEDLKWFGLAKKINAVIESIDRNIKTYDGNKG